MLGIILIIFMARQFYNLAADYNKNKWLWAILSIVIFYGVQFIASIIYILAFVRYEEEMQPWSSQYIINLLVSLLTSIAAAYFLYRYLKNKWELEEDMPTNDNNLNLLDDKVNTDTDAF